MTLSQDLIKRLPKAELHVHLDGSLRPATIIELAHEAGLAPPTEDPDGVAAAMLVSDAANLEEYLERFRYAVSLLQTPTALDRVAYEFVVDKAEENVRYIEVRYCPVLHAPAMSLERAFGFRSSSRPSVPWLPRCRAILPGWPLTIEMRVWWALIWPARS